MEREIVRDTFFLSQKAEPATRDDGQVIEDLKDTLRAHRDACVGMAANMIGEKKSIIIVSMGRGIDLVMCNPVITKKVAPYDTTEGCLSLDGERETTRYRSVEVEFEDENFHKKKQRFSGFAAQIVQHECDHLEGILI